MKSRDKVSTRIIATNAPQQTESENHKGMSFMTKAGRLLLILMLAMAMFSGACEKTPPPLNEAQKKAKEFDNLRFRISQRLSLKGIQGFEYDGMLLYLTAGRSVQPWMIIVSDKHRDYEVIRSIGSEDEVLTKFSMEDLDPTFKEDAGQYVRYTHFEKVKPSQ